MIETPCSTGKCGYGEPCRCDFYANWHVTPPCPAPRRIRTGGYRTGYRDGWKQGYAKGFHESPSTAQLENMLTTPSPQSLRSEGETLV